MQIDMKALKTTLLIALVGLVMQPAVAQTKRSLDFTPHIGLMAPIANVVDGGAIATSSPAAAHNLDFLLGGMLTYWWAPDWGIELGLMFAPNSIDSEAFGVSDAVDAQFFTISGRLVYDFGQNPAKPAFMLTGGLGAFFTNYDDPLSMKTGGMGLVGLGLRIPISNNLGLRIEVTDYLTTTNWELDNSRETDKLLQNDITVKGGLTFSFGQPVN